MKRREREDESERNPQCRCPDEPTRLRCPFGHLDFCHYPTRCHETDCYYDAYRRQIWKKEA